MAKRLEIDDAELVRLYLAGARAPAIARRLGCSTGTVYGRLTDAGVLRSRYSQLPYDEVIRLYTAEGWAATRIAEKYGVAARTITDGLRRNGCRFAASSSRCSQSVGRRAHDLPPTARTRSAWFGAITTSKLMVQPVAPLRFERIRRSPRKESSPSQCSNGMDLCTILGRQYVRR